MKKVQNVSNIEVKKDPTSVACILIFLFNGYYLVSDNILTYPFFLNARKNQAVVSPKGKFTRVFIHETFAYSELSNTNSVMDFVIICLN